MLFKILLTFTHISSLQQFNIHNSADNCYSKIFVYKSMVYNILYIIYIQLWYTILYNIYFSCYIQFLRLFFDLWSKRCSTNIPTPYIVCLSPLLLAWHDPRCVITITSPVVIGTMSSADGNLVIKCPPEVYFVIDRNSHVARVSTNTRCIPTAYSMLRAASDEFPVSCRFSFFFFLLSIISFN